MFCPSNARFITHRKGARWGNDAPGQPALRGVSLTSPPSVCYPTGSWALSESDHPFREVGIGAMPAVTSQQLLEIPLSPAVGRLRKLCPIFAVHSGVGPSICHHSNESAPVHFTAPRTAYTPELLKTISAFRLPYLTPPGQPSLTTNVPCLLPSPSQPPSILQAHRSTNCGGVLV